MVSGVQTSSPIDRKIDAARNDHQHLAHAHDGDEPEVAAVVVEIVVTAKRLGDQRHHDANDKNRKRDGRGLTKPYDPKTAHGRRSECSLRGHRRAFSCAGRAAAVNQREAAREVINSPKAEKPSVSATEP